MTPRPLRTLLVDNRDSFTCNLEHLLARATGTPPVVLRHDRLPEMQPEAHDLVVISPGPGAPEEYSGYERVIDSSVPVLGICLGMQILNMHFGGVTAPLDGCVHGKTDTALFDDGRTFTVARYHSLHVVTPGEGLRVCARTPAGLVMALRHESRPLMGYQFHPESFLTPDGVTLIHHALHTLRLR